MKVLHVMNGPNWGGSYSIATKLCSQQRELGIDAAICYLEGGQTKERVTALGLPLISYDPSRTYKSKFARWKDLERGYEKLLRDWQPDIIHTHGTLSNLLTGRVLSRYTKPGWVTLLHQSWRQFGFGKDLNSASLKKYYLMLRYGLGETWITRSCDRIITVSDAIRNDCLKFGMNKHRVKTIYNGLKVTIPEVVPDLRGEWGAASGTRVISSLGFFDPRKGFDLLILAFNKIAPAHPDTILVIAGGDIDGDRSYRNQLEELHEKSPFRERIQLLGEQKSGINFLANSDFCVVPSREEPASTVLIEAMHLGIPSVVTSAGGGNELARHEHESLVFESGNIADLADKLDRLLSDRELAAKLGKAAATKAHTQLTLERCARDYVALYKEVLSEKR